MHALTALASEKPLSNMHIEFMFADFLFSYFKRITSTGAGSPLKAHMIFPGAPGSLAVMVLDLCSGDLHLSSAVAKVEAMATEFKNSMTVARVNEHAASRARFMDLQHRLVCTTIHLATATPSVKVMGRGMLAVEEY